MKTFIFIGSAKSILTFELYNSKVGFFLTFELHHLKIIVDFWIYKSFLTSGLYKLNDFQIVQ